MILPVVQLMDFVATYRMDKEALTLLSYSFGSAPSTPWLRAMEQKGAHYKFSHNATSN